MPQLSTRLQLNPKSTLPSTLFGQSLRGKTIVGGRRVLGDKNG